MKEIKPENRKNKSNRTTMRPLGVLSHWNMYILSDVLKCWKTMIDFLMIFGDFGVFSLMVTDGRTDIRTDGQIDPLIEMRGRI